MFQTWQFVLTAVACLLIMDCDASVRRRLDTLEMEIRYINTSSSEMQMVIYNICDRFDELNETLSKNTHNCASSIQSESLSVRTLSHQVDKINRQMEITAHLVEHNLQKFHSQDIFVRRQLKRLQKQLHETKEEMKSQSAEHGNIISLLKDFVDGNVANDEDIKDLIKDKQIENENFNVFKTSTEERFQSCENAIKGLKEELHNLRESFINMKTTCPDGWRKVGRVCYMYVDDLKTWESAQEYCKRRGGFLLEPDSDQKVSALKENLLGEIQASSLWAGGKFVKVQGSWKGVWAGTNREMIQNRADFAFESNYRELCTVMWRSSASLWDAECNGLSPFICEQGTK